MLLYAKQHIFTCVKQKKVPNFTGLMYHLKFKHDIEKCIFNHNYEISKFEKLWFLWDHIFDFWWFFFGFLLFVFVIFTKINNTATLLKYNIYIIINMYIYVYECSYVCMSVRVCVLYMEGKKVFRCYSHCEVPSFYNHN